MLSLFGNMGQLLDLSTLTEVKNHSIAMCARVTHKSHTYARLRFTSGLPHSCVLSEATCRADTRRPIWSDNPSE